MTESDFDASKFAAEVLIQATEQTVKAAARPFRTALRRTIQGITDAYRPFLFRTHRRVSTIRTFLRPSESVDLLEHYVPVDLRTKSTELSVDEMIERLATGERFVISALAGGGKKRSDEIHCTKLFSQSPWKDPIILRVTEFKY